VTARLQIAVLHRWRLAWASEGAGHV